MTIENDFEDSDTDFISNIPSRDISITLTRSVFENESLITGDWNVDVRFGEQTLLLNSFNMPSVGLKAAITELEKQFSIKISDKK